MSDPAPASDPGSGSSPSRPPPRPRGSRGGRGRGRSAPRSVSDAIPDAPVEPLEDSAEELALTSQLPAEQAPIEETADDGADVPVGEVGEVSAPDEENFFAPAPEESAIEEPPAEAYEQDAGGPPARVEHYDRPPRQPLREARPERLPLPPPAQPAAPATIRKAIEEAEAVLSSLRDAVETLDELLELIEEAERQKTADEREIEAMRQTLRRFNGPTDQIPRRSEIVRPSRDAQDFQEPRPRPVEQPRPAEQPRGPGGTARYDDSENRRRGRRGGRGRSRGGRGGPPQGGPGGQGSSGGQTGGPPRESSGSGGNAPSGGGSHGTGADNAS